MDVDLLPYLIPYFVSAFISVGIIFYAWPRRDVPGTKPFVILVSSQAVWTFGYICELVAPTLQGKIFWDDVQFVTLFIWPLAFLAFVCEFSGRQWRRPRLLWSLLSVPFFIFFLMLFVDGTYHFIRRDVILVPETPFSILYYEFSPIVLITAVYIYALVFVGIYVLGRSFTRAHKLYRKQAGVVLIGTLFPIVGGLFTTFDIAFIGQRDITPLTFAISNLIIAWALYRYGLFDIVPVARETVVENMTDMVMVLDPQNRFVDINPAAQALLGVQNGELIGKPAREVLAQWTHLERLLDAQGEDVVETRITHGEESYCMAIKIRPLSGDGIEQNGRLIVASDITNMKVAEQKLQDHAIQLEIANKELLALSEVKDEFVANVSHELRTPLANLKLYHDLLLRKPEKLPKYTAILQRETDRLELIVEDLLMLSRLERDRDALQMEETDLNELVETLVLDRRRLAAKLGVDMQVQLQAELPLILVDSSTIMQVLSILLTNAVNYTPAGGMILVTTHAKEDEQSWLGFCVKDTGYGITAVDQAQLFTRFFRGGSSKKIGNAGTGLGLAIAKEIIDQHHGHIEVQSTGIPGEGTCVFIWLPQTSSSQVI